MNIKNVFIFIAGVGVGIGASYKYWKDKHEEILEEEIKSVKEVYSKKDNESEESPKETNSKEYNNVDSIDKESVYPDSIKEEYMDKVKEYTSDDIEKEKAEIYEIPEDEFGMEDYTEIEFTYYMKNKILTDDNDDPMDEDEIAISIGSIDTLKDVEDGDCKYFRNTEREIDYAVTCYDLEYYNPGPNEEV